jgi:hypothetical protein
MHGDMKLGRWFPFRAWQGICSMMPCSGKVRSRLSVFQSFPDSTRPARQLRYPQQIAFERLHLGIYFACKKVPPRRDTMKRTLEFLLTLAVLAAMYGVMPTSNSTSNAVAPNTNADVVIMADGPDPLPGCRICK